MSKWQLQSCAGDSKMGHYWHVFKGRIEEIFQQDYIHDYDVSEINQVLINIALEVEKEIKNRSYKFTPGILINGEEILIENQIVLNNKKAVVFFKIIKS